MKCLFVGAGRRVTMGELFIREGFTIDSYEYDANSPINTVANVIQGKKWSDDSIELEVRELILNQNYDLVLPFMDEATDLLSQLKEKYQIPSICVSEKRTTEICLNKKKFEEHFRNRSIAKYYPFEDGTEVVVKPIFGFASRGILFLDKCPEDTPKDCIVQKKIKGREFSVDCYFDKESNLLGLVPRERLRVTGGEVTESITVEPDLFGFNEIVKEIAETFQFVGPICMQFIVDEDEKVYIMEVNSRFGGGCTLSISSGMNMINMLKNEYVHNIKAEKQDWKIGLCLNRSYRDYYYETNSV